MRIRGVWAKTGNFAGSGTADDPYEIANIDDFKAMAILINDTADDSTAALVDRITSTAEVSNVTVRGSIEGGKLPE